MLSRLCSRCTWAPSCGSSAARLPRLAHAAASTRDTRGHAAPRAGRNRHNLQCRTSWKEDPYSRCSDWISSPVESGPVSTRPTTSASRPGGRPLAGLAHMRSPLVNRCPACRGAAATIDRRMACTISTSQGRTALSADPSMARTSRTLATRSRNSWGSDDNWWSRKSEKCLSSVKCFSRICAPSAAASTQARVPMV